MTKPKINRPKELHSLVFLILIVPITALCFLSIFSDVNTLVVYTLPWWIGFAVIASLLLVSLGIALYKNRALFEPEHGIIRRAFYLLAGLLSFTMLVAVAVLSGIPIVLHHFTAEPGSMFVTITDKKDEYSKNECSPRLEIEEFTFMMSKYLCPSDRAYDQVEIGDQIRISGQLSQYGIEAEEMHWRRR
uniref:hypothetical protein n=1 Tax=Thaumasiovibrio occultus TaxID=1891184 RepID=UPI000B354D6F|nr:hypothetical protein [Thaumasiovibrio occultus]